MKKEIRDPEWTSSMSHRKKKDEEAEKKALINRMSRAIGHMESVKRMIEDDRDAAETLIQLAAVRSAISGISRAILQEHIEDTIRGASEHEDNSEELQDLNKVISYFIK